MTVFEFQKQYPEKKEKIRALKKMSDSEIDELINDCNNIYGKIFYSGFKSNNKTADKQGPEK